MCELIKLKDGKFAFTCSCGHTLHECNEDSSILILSNGERVEDTPENQKKHYKKVRGGSVACSICGKAAIDNAPYL